MAQYSMYSVLQLGPDTGWLVLHSVLLLQDEMAHLRYPVHNNPDILLPSRIGVVYSLYCILSNTSYSVHSGDQVQKSTAGCPFHFETIVEELGDWCSNIFLALSLGNTAFA